jgi:hypothetical protein
VSGAGDDPDDVTLWAGRLRPWPAPEQAQPEEADDATRLVRRRGAAQPLSSENASPAASEDQDEGADDATRIVRRQHPDARSEVDDATALAGRRRPAAVAQPDVADDVDDATALAGRRGPVAAAPAAPAEPIAPPEPAEETELRPTTRREAFPRIAAPAHTERSARVPTGEAREIYKPRAPEPVVAVRRAPAPAVPSTPEYPDTAATDRRTRRRRLRMLIAGGIVVLAVVLAAAAVVVLVVLPTGG